jgi:hypothetical protein
MNFFEKKYAPFFTLFFLVFSSRLPFLYAGYGVEEDSWGIALAAFHTKLTGMYEPSRLPGHPVQELIYSVLWGAGPIVYNGLCAFFSSVAVVFFALILKQLNFKHFFIASLAFAFIPVYFISSTYTIDFVWTEAFALISFYCLLKNNFLLCGIFLGLAIGCRITSGAMLLPFMLIAWQNNQLKQNVLTLLKISVPMALVAFIVFVPVIQQFGLSFFMYYDQFPYPPVAKVLYKMVIGVFGLVGTVAMGVALLLIVFNYKKQNVGTLFANGLDKKIIAASIVIIVLYTISYFRLPQKSGYMIAVLPFVIILLGYYLNGKNFIAICVAIVLSPFVCSINLTDKLRGAEYSDFAKVFTVAGQEIFFDPITGPLFSDYSKRKQKMKYTETVIEKINVLQQNTVVIAGWWYNEVMVELIEKNKNNFVIFESYIDAIKINKYLSEGYQLVYLPEQNKYNDLMYKMNITDNVSTELK